MSAAAPREVARALERVEAEAWRDVWAAAPAEVAGALGLECRDLGGGVALRARGLPSLLHNRAIGFGVERPATGADVDALVAFAAGASEGFAINHSPLARPDDLAARWATLGFGTFFHHRKYVRDASPDEAPPGAPRVLVCGPSEAARWAELAREAHDPDEPDAMTPWRAAVVGRPGWTHLIAWEGRQPIALAALFVRAGAAWMGAAATLAAWRRRGAQRALIAARIQAAAAAGARWITTETGPDWDTLPGESRRNVERAGFRLLYERPSWIGPVPQ